jgi:hypothetical protein
LIVLLNLHLKLRRQQELITQLARVMALREPAGAGDGRVRGAAPAPQPAAGRRSTQTHDQSA